MNCGDPTANLSSQLIIYKAGSSPNNFKYKMNITVVCQIGFLFNGLSVEMTLTCSPNGKWTPPVPECIGSQNSSFPPSGSSFNLSKDEFIIQVGDSFFTWNLLRIYQFTPL